jgi:hypothetical protein
MPGRPAAYVRNQAVAAALVNAILNPLIEWVANRDRGFQPFWGSDGVVVNMAVTSIILSVLVALFAARGARHELVTGRIAPVPASRGLSWLPRRAGWLGLLLGAGAAVLVAIAFWLLDAAGVSGLSFGALLIVKAGYCGVLGFAVARWTIMRLLGTSSVNTP